MIMNSDWYRKINAGKFLMKNQEASIESVLENARIIGM